MKDVYLQEGAHPSTTRHFAPLIALLAADRLLNCAKQTDPRLSRSAILGQGFAALCHAFGNRLSCVLICSVALCMSACASDHVTSVATMRSSLTRTARRRKRIKRMT